MGLSGDRRQRAATLAENIDMHLAAGETKEAWRCLKGWYRAASEQAPTASHTLLTTQTAKHVALYGRVPPPGDPLPIHVDKVDIPDGVPERSGTAGGRAGTSKHRQNTSKCGCLIWFARKRSLVP